MSKKKQSKKYTVQVTWEKGVGYGDRNGWHLERIPQDLGHVMPGAEWTVSMTQLFDDNGNPLAVPVTTRLTLRSVPLS